MFFLRPEGSHFPVITRWDSSVLSAALADEQTLVLDHPKPKLTNEVYRSRNTHLY